MVATFTNINTLVRGRDSKDLVAGYCYLYMHASPVADAFVWQLLRKLQKDELVRRFFWD